MNWFNKIKSWFKSGYKGNNLKCPNCKNDQWIEGPGGGSFGNIQCPKCLKKYNNLGPFGLQEIGI